MHSRVISFDDIANCYTSVKYGSVGMGRQGCRLVVDSKYGHYVRVWDKHDNVLETTFSSEEGYTLIDEGKVYTNINDDDREYLHKKAAEYLDKFNKAKSKTAKVRYFVLHTAYMEMWNENKRGWDK